MVPSSHMWELAAFLGLTTCNKMNIFEFWTCDEVILCSRSTWRAVFIVLQTKWFIGESSPSWFSPSTINLRSTCQSGAVKTLFPSSKQETINRHSKRVSHRGVTERAGWKTYTEDTFTLSKATQDMNEFLPDTRSCRRANTPLFPEITFTMSLFLFWASSKTTPWRGSRMVSWSSSSLCWLEPVWLSIWALYMSRKQHGNNNYPPVTKQGSSDLKDFKHSL